MKSVFTLSLLASALLASNAKAALVCEENLIPVDGPYTVAILETKSKDQMDITLAEQGAGLIPFFRYDELNNLECYSFGSVTKCERDWRPVDGALERVFLVKGGGIYRLNRTSTFAVQFTAEEKTVKKTYGLRGLECRNADDAEVARIKKELQKNEEEFRKLKRFN